MIKIVQGVYGFRKGKCVIPKTSKDAPFELDEVKEKRLVDAGIAVYVDTKAAKTAKAEEVKEPVKEDAKKETVTPTKEQLVAEYKALKLGGNPAGMKPETLIRKIEEAKAAKAEEETEEVAEDAPDFSEVDGVVE